MKNGPITIPQAAEIAGLKVSTARDYVKRAGLQPVASRISYRTALYDKETILEAIAEGALASKFYSDGSEECKRCGHIDYGMDSRDGLCFECWSKDYCKTRKERIIKARGLNDYLEA